MRRFMMLSGISTALVMLVAMTAVAEDAKELAIKQDRKLIEGTWAVVELQVNGNKAEEADARKLTVVNGSDGSWALLSGGKEVAKGTSTIDPTQKPKTLDFSSSEGEDKGKLYLGVYEYLGENRRQMCFAPIGAPRPTSLTSSPGSQHILVVFERVKAK